MKEARERAYDRAREAGIPRETAAPLARTAAEQAHRNADRIARGDPARRKG